MGSLFLVSWPLSSSFNNVQGGIVGSSDKNLLYSLLTTSLLLLGNLLCGLLRGRLLDRELLRLHNIELFGRRLGLGRLDIQHHSLTLGGRLGGLRLAGWLLGSSLL